MAIESWGRQAERGVTIERVRAGPTYFAGSAVRCTAFGLATIAWVDQAAV